MKSIRIGQEQRGERDNYLRGKQSIDVDEWGGGNMEKSRLRVLSKATVLCSGDPITTVPRAMAVCVYLPLIHDVSHLSSTAKSGFSHPGYRTIKLKSGNREEFVAFCYKKIRIV